MLNRSRWMFAALVFVCTYEGVAAGRPGWTKALLTRQSAGHAAPDAALLARLSAERIHDYDAFTVVRVPEASIAKLSKAAREHGFGVEPVPEWDVVHMPGRTIDTRTPVQARGGHAIGLFVVQFASPMMAEWEEKLTSRGLRYVGYLPYNAALVFGPQASVLALADDPDVQWTSPYDPAFRAQPAAYPLTNETASYVVQVVNVPGNEAVLQRLRLVNEGRPREVAYVQYVNVFVEAYPVSMGSFIEDPHVVSVTTRGVQLVSGEREAIAATGLTQTYTGEVYQNGVQPFKGSSDYRQWLANRGVLDTSNYKIAFADTGYGVQPDNARPEHPDLARAGTTVKSYISGVDALDRQGHGTMVAGVALGDPAAVRPSNMTSQTDAGGYYYGMGIAPKTKIFAQKIIVAGSEPTGTQMMWANDARLEGATVQTHSHNDYTFGSLVGAGAGVYSQEAQEYDVAVRDTSAADSIDTPLPVTVSAGNICSGADYATGDCTTMVLSPATAKNVLSVGSAEGYYPNYPYTTCEDPLLVRQPGDFLAASFKNVAAHSRRGTLDGRIKPDIIAPATVLSSTRTPYKVSSVQRGAFCRNTADGYYSTDSGTSFAAPQAAAAYVLLDKKRNQVLSPAMLKAVVIGGSLSVKGGLDRRTNTTVGIRGSVAQGFGRLHLGDLLGNSLVQTYFDEGSLATFTGAGQTYQRVMQVVDTTKPAILVLAWTDEPGVVNTANPNLPVLVRNLNIGIGPLGTSCQYMVGNSFTTTDVSKNWSCNPPTYDTKNNVEMIVIPANNSFQAFQVYIGVSTWGFGTHNQKFALYALNAN